MSLSFISRRTLVLVLILAGLVALLLQVALRSGPLAPVPVTETTVEARALQPALFGVGTVEARYTYRIGPTTAGRLKQLAVEVGDTVQAGDLLGEMDPVDLAERIRAQSAAIKRAEAWLAEAEARQTYARQQSRRYEQLPDATSAEMRATKKQDAQIASAAHAAAREELARTRADLAALHALRANLRLLAPVAGIVTLRAVEPGSTVIAGETVVEMIDPARLWVNVRFDQLGANGLAAGLPAHIALRSRNAEMLLGQVLRVEPKADAVTEELLAKVVFDAVPAPLPPLGELAEVTVDLPALPATPVVPNAALHRDGTQTGVWRITAEGPQFVTVRTGRSDLDGQVQVLEGLVAGDRIVAYSSRPLDARSRITVVERMPGVPQ